MQKKWKKKWKKKKKIKEKRKKKIIKIKEVIVPINHLNIK